MQGKNNKIIYPLFIIPVFILFLQSCAPTASFSEPAYRQAVQLKVDALELMDKATDGYSNHKSEVDSFKHKLNFAYEYAKGRRNNEITVKQWEIMINPDRNLIGGFLRIWKEDLLLSPVFVKEAKDVIEDAFDTIIGLESGKIKSSNINEE